MHSNLVLYTRQGCHLCEAFLAELQQFDAGLCETLHYIDVDDSPADVERFGDKVPILLANGVEICRYYFDADKLESCLKRQGDSLE